MKAAATLTSLPRTAWRRLWGIGRIDTLPVTLTQSRIYVFPTGAGLGFAGALLVMLIGAINYSLSLGYALVFLLFGLGVSGTVHAFRNLLALEADRAHVDPVFAGETAVLRVLVENRRNFRRPALRLQVDATTVSFELAPCAATEVELGLATRQRGWMPVERIRISTTWPLGLVRAWCILRPSLACLVYPAPEKSPPPLPQGREGEDGKRPRNSGDDDFAGLRNHRLTDSPRHVAWKAAASGRPLLTKEFSAHEDDAISLDWFGLPPGFDDETRAARLAAWVLSAEARGLRYALRTPDGELPALRGTAHMRACLSRLAIAKSPHGQG